MKQSLRLADTSRGNEDTRGPDLAEQTYHPWRSDSAASESKAAGDIEAWQDLVEESRRYVDQLRQLTGQLDSRLNVGGRLYDALSRQSASITQQRQRTEDTRQQVEQHLEDFRSRLEKIETRLIAVEQLFGRLMDQKPQSIDTSSGSPSFRDILAALRQQAA